VTGRIVLLFTCHDLRFTAFYGLDTEALVAGLLPIALSFRLTPMTLELLSLIVAPRAPLSPATEC
jgi:hypothetical protein